MGPQPRRRRPRPHLRRSLVFDPRSVTQSLARRGASVYECPDMITTPILLSVLALAGSPTYTGLDKKGFDTSVSPADDLFEYVNGTWMQETEIPADKSDYSMFTHLEDDALENIKKIVEET